MLLIYTTLPNMQQAQDLAHQVVAHGLAAGANIIPGMHSIYHWQGEIVQAQECICLFQSTHQAYAALELFIKERHSYEVPCIIAMPLEKAEAQFAAWIQQHCVP